MVRAVLSAVHNAHVRVLALGELFILDELIPRCSLWVLSILVAIIVALYHLVALIEYQIVVVAIAWHVFSATFTFLFRVSLGPLTGVALQIEPVIPLLLRSGLHAASHLRLLIRRVPTSRVEHSLSCTLAHWPPVATVLRRQQLLLRLWAPYVRPRSDVPLLVLALARPQINWRLH